MDSQRHGLTDVPLPCLRLLPSESHQHARTPAITIRCSFLHANDLFIRQIRSIL